MSNRIVNIFGFDHDLDYIRIKDFFTLHNRDPRKPGGTTVRALKPETRDEYFQLIIKREWKKYQSKLIEGYSLQEFVSEQIELTNRMIAQNPDFRKDKGENYRYHLAKRYMEALEAYWSKSNEGSSISFNKIARQRVEAPQTERSKSWEEIFVDEQAMIFAEEAMVELGITNKAGECVLTTRKRGRLLGFIYGLRQKKLIFDLGDPNLTKLFCERINTPYTRLKTQSQSFDKAKSETISYINRHKQ